MDTTSRSNPSFLRSLAAIVWKDLAAELHSRELLSSMLVFSLLITLIFSFALELEKGLQAEITSGMLWVTILFSGTIGLNRSLSAEKDRDCLDGLLLAPVDRSAIYLGKVLSNWIFLLVSAAFLLPVYGLLFNQNLFNGGIIFVILLGSLGYTAVGTLLAAMTVQARTRDILLPILLFPVSIPILIAAVKASSAFLQGIPFSEIRIWLDLMAVYDVIFITAAWMVFENIMEE